MSGQQQARGLNRIMLRKLLVVAVLMFGFGYALIPVYRKICEVTGVNFLTPKDATVSAPAPGNTQVDTSRTVTVEFDGNAQDHGASGRRWPACRCIRGR